MKLVKFIVFFLIIISIVISSYCLILIIKDMKEEETNESDLIELENTIIKEKEDNKTIDWNELKSINEDIVAWIEIENTPVNYTILKDNNNLYYLKHNFNKKYNSNGSIFTLNKDFIQDDEVIIYGHNMRNKTMFSILGNYLNTNFLKEHQIMKIYTENKNYVATIFSCYSIGVNEESNNIRKLCYEDRISYYKTKSNIDTENIEDTGKIIKLSTCSYINAKTTPTDQRYYVVAMMKEVE
mgnify:CR=1 FL=1